MFKTPVFHGILYAIARGVLRAFGWTTDDMRMDHKRCIITAAPHTSNWDFLFALAVCWGKNVDIHWMGKDSMFPFPFRTIMIWMGGIPVDRRRGQHAALNVLRALKEADELRVIIPPEGTRSLVTTWKRGFYKLASDANVPIVCGYLDYKRKVGGFGPTVIPTGDYDSDLRVMLDFYRTITPKYPENTNLTTTIAPPAVGKGG